MTVRKTRPCPDCETGLIFSDTGHCRPARENEPGIWTIICDACHDNEPSLYTKRG